jgi:hypothetical protein
MPGQTIPTISGSNGRNRLTCTDVRSAPCLPVPAIEEASFSMRSFSVIRSRYPGVVFGNFVVLFAESAWFLARRDDEVVAGLLREGATQPGAAMAREEHYWVFQTGH